MADWMSVSHYLDVYFALPGCLFRITGMSSFALSGCLLSHCIYIHPHRVCSLTFRLDILSTAYQRAIVHTHGFFIGFLVACIDGQAWLAYII
jgi:hypothetical protein